jgi:myo-inositol-1(or 4)-monophosphatase
MERTAVRLVRLASAVIVAARGNPGDVIFKGGANRAANTSPASDVDRDVELMLRDEIRRAFPDHGIIGEELDDDPAPDADYVWVLDPLDGTSNYLNGFPLFASTIGVLRNGVPVVGATWCMTTHTGESGVYHAHEGSSLCFEQHTLERRATAAWRGLAGQVSGAPRLGRSWDTRVIGSAATECAYVAAGMLRIASLHNPRIWDVAGGVLLARAAGCVVYSRTTLEWKRLARFATDERGLRAWRQAVLMGDANDVQPLIDDR